MQDQQENQDISKSKPVPKWIRRLFFLLVVVFFLAIALLSLIQTERVQTFLIKKVTTDLAEKLERDITIKRIDLSFPDYLVLNDVFIEDLDRDTLLFVKQIKADNSSNIFQLLQQRFYFDGLYLTGFEINLNKHPAHYYTNLDLWLGKLQDKNLDPTFDKYQARLDSIYPDSVAPKDVSFQLDLKCLELSDVSFVKNDSVQGQKMTIYLPNAHFGIEDIDLDKNQIQLSNAIIDRPQVSITDYKRDNAFFLNQVEKQYAIREKKDTIKGQKPPMTIFSSRLQLLDGTFNLQSPRRSTFPGIKPGEINFDYLSFSGIHFDINGFRMQDTEFFGNVDKFACKEQSGFEVKNWTADSVFVTRQGAGGSDMKIRTNGSQLEGDLRFDFNCYTAWENFPNEVAMDIDIQKGEVLIKDILSFAGKLNENPFFEKNQKSKINLVGQFSGLVNQLDGNNLVLNLADQIYVEGFFSSNDLWKRGSEYMYGEVKSLKTKFENLKYFIPNFNPPNNYDNLGNLHFTGNFNGFFSDFVSFGRLETELGVIQMDLQLNTQEGRNLARYQGDLQLQDFHVGRWLENDKLGRVSAKAYINNGVGLYMDNLYADFNASIQSLEYNQYTYQNATFEGIVDRKKIDGNFSIADPNIQANLAGSFDFRTNIPAINTKASIKAIHLKDLNFSKRDLVLSTDLDVNLKLKNLTHMNGTAQTYLFQLNEGATKYIIDSVFIETSYDSTSGYRELAVSSELLDGNIDGQYLLEDLPGLVNNLIIDKFNGFAQRYDWKRKNVKKKDARFKGALELKDAKNWLNLVDNQIAPNQQLDLNFEFNHKTQYLNVNGFTPVFQLGEERFEEIYLYTTISNNGSDLEADIRRFKHRGKEVLGPLNVYTYLKPNSLDFDITVNDLSEIIHDFVIEGSLSVDENNTQISLLPSDLRLFDEAWTLEQNNKILLTSEGIEVDNFKLRSNDKEIHVFSSNNKNLFVNMRSISLQYLDYVWQDNVLDLDGRMDVDVSIENLKTLEDLHLVARTDSFLINDDYWGPLKLEADAANLKKPLIGKVIWEPLDGYITGNLTVYPRKINPVDLPYGQNPGDIDLRLNVDDMPVSFAKYHLAGICSDFDGSVDGQMNIRGQGKNLDVSGFIDFENTAFNVDYLGTRYRVENHRVLIKDDIFDATGAVLLDKFNNRAFLEGGITHQGLKNLGLKATLQTDNFLGLETTKEQNSTFYGTGIGSARILFDGLLSQPEMVVYATTKEGTEIFIPVENDADDSEVDFVRFVFKDEVSESDTLVGETLRGLNLEMNLDLTENAQMNLIFDERVGDVLKGRGFGSLQLLLNRTGEFNMYGDFEVITGSYLFTYSNFYINKPFAVEPGGTVRWNGDPFSAQLDITATYHTNTSLYLLLSDLLVGIEDTRILQEASTITNVELKMNLTDELLSPTINFDLEFPFLSNDIAPFAENKLNTLRQNQGELNRQVFGLLVMGSFLPENSFGINNSIVTTTLSQWLATQLSLYFSDLLTEIFQDLGFVNGVDFLVSYQDLSSVTTATQAISNSNRELSLQMKNYLFNNRVSLTFGGDFGLANNTLPNQSNRLTGGNIQLEYFLTADRRLKLNIYSRFSDNYFDNARLKTGTGITFRKEFDTFKEFFKKKSEIEQDYKNAIKN